MCEVRMYPTGATHSFSSFGRSSAGAAAGAPGRR